MRREIALGLTVAAWSCADGSNAPMDEAQSADASGTTDGGEDDPAGTSGDEAGPVWGVTIDAIEPLSEIVDALSNLHVRPTTRIVFDEFVPASEYTEAVEAIAPVSDIMGEVLDSFYVAQYSTDEYEARVIEYLDVLGPMVDIWEVGNEINGEWLCAEDAESCSPEQLAEVVAKMQTAFDQVEARDGTTALTLYYNEDCWSSPDNEMFAWAEANVPQSMRDGLDYVFVSYYEDDCNDLQPDWPSVFTQLAQMFPDAKLGFGECGTLDGGAKAEFVMRYYGTQIDEPSFVGGYFWWYFLQDMVPRDKPLWSVLDQSIAQ